MSKKPSKSELIRQVNSLKVDFLKTFTEYESVRDEVLELRLGYIKLVHKAFATAGVKACRIPKNEREMLKQYYDIEAMERLPSYSWFSAFAVLKRSTRQLKRLSKTHYKSKKFVIDFLGQIKEIDRSMTDRNMDETNPGVYAGLIKLRDLALLIKNENLFDRSSFYPCLQMPFIKQGWKMQKHDLLQIISIDKGKKYWDDVPVTPFAERFNELPDELDFEAFEKAIFIQKIEHDQDCYLFDIFMGHMLEVMDNYKKENGESMFDTFGMLEKISGKPLRTFTATTDEYGDIVNMEPNKPNLKLVEGGVQ